MTIVDWVVIAVIALAALNGFRRGLVGGALSLAGLAVGAYVGARLAPQFLSDGDSAYTPLVALGGAVGLAFLLQGVASIAGGIVRGSILTIPPLRVLDSALGIVLGAVTGIALVWVLGAVALNLPGQTDLRREVQASKILERINREFPPQRLMDAIARVDPFDSIRGRTRPSGRPTRASRTCPASSRRRRPSCASPARPAASGSRARAGSRGRASSSRTPTSSRVSATRASTGVTGSTSRAEVVAFDVRNDVAVLRVAGLSGQRARRSPTLGRARRSRSSAIRRTAR